MRQVLERTVEKPVVKWAKDRGIMSVKLAIPGQRGFPDRMFFIPGGRPFLIEFKAPGKAPEDHQGRNHWLLRKFGYDVQVHDNFDSAVRAIGARVSKALAP